MNRYLNEFLNLKCSGDVLNIVNPLGRKAEKEITEAMAIVKRIKLVTIGRPMKYTLYDFCAGNALGSILSTFLLPIKQTFAFDKTPLNRKYETVKRFKYIEENIYNFDEKTIVEDSIIMAIHSCGDLANRICDIYLNSKARYLFLIPCCNGVFNVSKYPEIMRTKLGKYVLWSLELRNKVDGKMFIDNYCLSPKNCVIVAEK